MNISLELIILIVALTAAFFLFAITFGIRAHRKKVSTGYKGMVGEQGEAISNLNPKGEIQIHGEIWTAESSDGKIKKGSPVTVTAIENLKLIVKKITL